MLVNTFLKKTFANEKNRLQTKKNRPTGGRKIQGCRKFRAKFLTRRSSGAPFRH